MAGSKALAPYVGTDLIGRIGDFHSPSPEMQDVEELPVVPKTEHSREGSVSSIDSDLEPELDGQTTATDNVQVQKRKGGRKPVSLGREDKLMDSTN